MKEDLILRLALMLIDGSNGDSSAKESIEPVSMLDSMIELPK